MKSARLHDDVHQAAKRRAVDTKSKLDDVLDNVLRPALLPTRRPARQPKATK